MLEKIESYIQSALECSVYISPSDHGLSYEELFEVVSRFGYKRGEFDDALRLINSIDYNKKRYVVDGVVATRWSFYLPEDPEYRNLSAFDFLISQLNDRVREDGRKRAQIAKNVLIERGVSAGLARKDIEVAVTCLVLAGQIREEGGYIKYTREGPVRSLPSESRAATRPIPRPYLQQVYPVVEDVIARRTDGRPSKAEPFDAFADALSALGYRPFRLWWGQIVSELRQTNDSAAPVSTLVLAAGIVEAALTFVVRHARDQNLAVFKSTDFEGEPRKWRLENLVKSASMGGEAGILDAPAKAGVEALINARQRIHAGRMLSEYPNGPADLRPEEAREAKATAEKAVRCVLDWLDRFPANASTH